MMHQVYLRTWIDGLYSLLTMGQIERTGYNFHDLSAKYQNIINNRNKVFLSVYTSRDKFYDRFNEGNINTEYSFNWGNYTGLFRWSSQLNDNTFLSNSLSYSNYYFKQLDKYSSTNNNQSREVDSNIKEWNINSTIDYFPSLDHEIKLGIQATYRSFQPEVTQLVNATNFNRATNQNYLSGIIDLFVEDKITLNEHFVLDLGVRNSLLIVNKNVVFFPQPRIQLNYRIFPDLKIIGSFDRIVQPIHLLTNTSLGQPTDLWVPSTDKVPPGISNHYSLGIYKIFPGDLMEIGLDFYGKTFNNIIEYKEGANYLYGINENWEDKVAIGKGYSKGIELTVRKNIGKINGFIP